MKTFNRIFFGIWSLLFLLFAFWQWNDPDPVIWMAIYGYAAIMTVLASIGRYPIPFLTIGFFLGLAGFLYMYPGALNEWIAQEWQQQDLSMKTPHMEEAREAFGLLIVSLILGMAAFFGWWRKNQARKKVKALTGTSQTGLFG